MANVTIEAISGCAELKIIDARPYHPCYNWNHSNIQCELDWPCEVRQYLVSISPLINVTRGLLSYGTLIVILLGLSLNLLSLCILVSSGISKSGSGIYLISLAICDIGNLLTNYAVGIARAHIPGFNDIFMECEWLCRWHAVFVEIFQLMSAWIVVIFTVERCLAIWYPILLRQINRIGRARKVIFWLVSLLLTLFSLSKLVLTGFEKDSVFGYAACYSQRYHWRGIEIVCVAFETWIPTILVSTFNLLMFYKLGQLKRARRSLTEVQRPAGRRKASIINRPSPTAPMLVAVSLAYLVLVFPLGVVQTVELVWNLHNKEPMYELDDVAGRQLFIQWKNTKLLLKNLRSFCFALYQINFCINFFLYFAAGLQFRMHLQQEAKRVFNKCCGESANEAEGKDGPEPVISRTSISILDSKQGSLHEKISWKSSTGTNQEESSVLPVPSLSNKIVEESFEDMENDRGKVIIDQINICEDEMEPVEELDYEHDYLDYSYNEICMESLTSSSKQALEPKQQKDELADGAHKQVVVDTLHI